VLYDHYTDDDFEIGTDQDFLIIDPYGFHLLQPVRE